MTDSNTQPKPAPKPEPKPKADPTPEVKLTPVIEQKPVAALGRNVLYVTANATVRPAVISALNEDETVDLTVFNSAGAVPVTAVDLDPFEGETPGTYHWPSY